MSETPHLVRSFNLGPYVDSRFPTWVFYYGPKKNTYQSCGNDEIVRVSDPNWSAKLARGENASNPYLRREYNKVVPASSSAETFYSPYGTYNIVGSHEHTGLGFYWSPIEVPDDPVLADVALGKLKRKLASHVQSINTLVPIAELRDLRRTIRGVTEASTGVTKELLNIRKNYKHSAGRAADAWLTFSFGVKPMINEVRQGIGSVQAYLERSGHSVRLTGTASKTWSSSGKFDSSGPYGAKMIETQNLGHELSYKYIAGFDLSILSSNNYTLDRHLGFTTENLPSTSWELVPYSWLVDYFSTVGAYLDDTFVSPPGVTKYVVLCKRYRCKAGISLSYEPWTSDNYILTSSSDGSGTVDYFSFERSVLADLPHAMLRFRTIDEVGRNGVNKLLNLASLLVSRRFARFR